MIYVEFRCVSALNCDVPALCHEDIAMNKENTSS